MANIHLTIDGKALSVPAGSTILEAAEANGIRIPTLCFLKGLDPHASCRMCVVEVAGARTFQHACPARPGNTAGCLRRRNGTWLPRLRALNWAG